MRKSRIALTLTGCLALAGAAAAALALSGGGEGASRPQMNALPGASAADSPASPGSQVKFAFLARQTSNSCGLQPDALAGMSSQMRLQGSCCFPMDLSTYQSQVRGLRVYAAVPVIPHDPYDVPVSLAQRLLAYDRAIHLAPAQAQSYSRGMRMSHLKGPCCCRCWRWYAFRGLSKHVIADLGWRPKRIAALIDLLEGCGGPADDAHSSRST